MLHHPPPETHGLYLDHTPTGIARIAVTHAGRRKNRPGRRILALTGPHRDAAYPALSQILRQHTGHPLQTQAADLPPGEYHRFNEYCANQLLMAMHAVQESRDPPPRPNPGPSHRRNARLRGRLVVCPVHQPPPPPQGCPSPGIAVCLDNPRPPYPYPHPRPFPPSFYRPSRRPFTVLPA